MGRRILAVAAYEFLNILRDPKLRIIVFFIPLFFAGIFGAVYSFKTIEEMPVAVLNEDNTPLSREIVRAFDASDKFHVVCYVDSYDEIKALLDRDQAKVGLVIPKDLEKRVVKGNPVEILTVFDSSNLIYGYTIRRTALMLTLNLSAQIGVKMLAAQGILTNRAIEIINAIDFRSMIWYNPTTNYVNFLYLGLLLLIVHQVCVVCSGISFTREREEGSFLQFSLAPLGKFEIAVGKGLPYFMAGIFDFCLLLFLANRILELPIGGNFLLLLGMAAVMFAGIVGMGFCLSLLCDNSVQPTRIVVATSLPLFLASGFTWPLESMPSFIRWVMYCQPLTWMLKGARAITMKGNSFEIISGYFAILGMMAGLFWIGTYLLLRFAARKQFSS